MDKKLITAATENTAAAGVLPLHDPAHNLPSSNHYSPRNTYHSKGVDWADARYDILNTIPRRFVGSGVKAVLGTREIPEFSVAASFDKNEDGTYKYNTKFNRHLRFLAQKADAAYNLALGKDRALWEPTDKGREHYGSSIDITRHDITEEDIDQGYFRKRLYGLTADELEAIRKKERGETLTAEEEGYYTASVGKHRSYGTQWVFVSTDFAWMGQADHITKEFLTNPVKGAMGFANAALKGGDDFEEWKQRFNLPANLAKAVRGTLENAMRADFVYDYAVGIIYTDFKEAYSRKKTDDSSGLKNMHTFFNWPFVFYNWLGKFVWQDLMIDWWLRPQRSRLLKHLREHAPDPDMPAYQKTWNLGAELINFSVIRGYQIVGHMLGSVSAFFSPARYYATEAQEEITAQRITALIDHLITSCPPAALANEDLRKALEDIRDRTRSQMKTSFSADDDVPPPKINAAKANGMSAAAIVDIKAAVRHHCPELATDNFERSLDRAAYQFIEDYVAGKKPAVAFSREDNTRSLKGQPIAFEGPLGAVDKGLIQAQDVLGNAIIKPATFQFSGLLQRCISAAVRFFNGGNAPSMKENLQIIRIADQWTNDYFSYGPYFAAKRVVDNISRNSGVFNAPVVGYEHATAPLKFANPMHGDTVSAARIEQGKVADSLIGRPPLQTGIDYNKGSMQIA